MTMPSLSRLALIAAGLAAGCARGDLVQASPFLPVAGSAAAAAAASTATPVELRGIMTTSEGVVACIYDTAKKTSVWVGADEPGFDFQVRTIDTERETATVFYQGRVISLGLKQAKIASSGPGPVQVAQPAPGNPARAVTDAPVVTAADEQKRLDAVAAEVRRRRLEREKAYQAGQNPGAQPPPAPNR
jgi:hypothetical protein